MPWSPEHTELFTILQKLSESGSQKLRDAAELGMSQVLAEAEGVKELPPGLLAKANDPEAVKAYLLGSQRNAETDIKRAMGGEVRSIHETLGREVDSGEVADTIRTDQGGRQTRNTVKERIGTGAKRKKVFSPLHGTVKDIGEGPDWERAARNQHAARRQVVQQALGAGTKGGRHKAMDSALRAYLMSLGPVDERKTQALARMKRQMPTVAGQLGITRNITAGDHAVKSLVEKLATASGNPEFSSRNLKMGYALPGQMIEQSRIANELGEYGLPPKTAPAVKKHLSHLLRSGGQLNATAVTPLSDPIQQKVLELEAKGIRTPHSYGPWPPSVAQRRAQIISEVNEQFGRELPKVGVSKPGRFPATVPASGGALGPVYNTSVAPRGASSPTLGTIMESRKMARHYPVIRYPFPELIIPQAGGGGYGQAPPPGPPPGSTPGPPPGPTPGPTPSGPYTMTNAGTAGPPPPPGTRPPLTNQGLPRNARFNYNNVRTSPGTPTPRALPPAAGASKSLLQKMLGSRVGGFLGKAGGVASKAIWPLAIASMVLPFVFGGDEEDAGEGGVGDLDAETLARMKMLNELLGYEGAQGGGLLTQMGKQIGERNMNFDNAQLQAITGMGPRRPLTDVQPWAHHLVKEGAIHPTVVSPYYEKLMSGELQLRDQFTNPVKYALPHMLSTATGVPAGHFGGAPSPEALAQLEQMYGQAQQQGNPPVTPSPEEDTEMGLVDHARRTGAFFGIDPMKTEAAARFLNEANPSEVISNRWMALIKPHLTKLDAGEITQQEFDATMRRMQLSPKEVKEYIYLLRSGGRLPGGLWTNPVDSMAYVGSALTDGDAQYDTPAGYR